MVYAVTSTGIAEKQLASYSSLPWNQILEIFQVYCTLLTRRAPANTTHTVRSVSK